MKKIFMFIGLIVFLNAEVLDKIVATINDMPITSYEVEKLSKQLNIDKNRALNILLNQKLIESEIKKRGIVVDNFELENALEVIAKRNGFSLFEFKNILMQRGDYQKLINQIKNDLLKNKLFDEIVQTKLKIDDNEIKNYYQNHKNEFKVCKKIEVVKYSANNKALLEKIKQNPLSIKNLKVENKIYYANELPLNLLFLFKETKDGAFTPIINESNERGYYSMFYVTKKENYYYLPFEKVKNLITNKLINKKREKILKEYFSKLKNKAYVKFYN